MKTRKCSKCKAVKSISDFYAAKPGKSKSWCKECEKLYQREMYANDPAKRLERARKWREKYSEKHNAKRRENRRAIYVTESARKYGISKEQASRLADEVNCGCCGVAFDKSVPLLKMNIDHCHKSGRVRGAICSRCNTVLGLLGDDIAVSEEITAYIARS